MKIKMLSIAACAALCLTAAAVSFARDGATTQPATQPAAPINKMCAVMPDDEIDPKVFVIYKDKKVAFCCKECITEFNKDPEKYMKKLK